MAFPAIMGRQLDTPVINLGFSGSGKMEPAMAELLPQLDLLAYVLDCLWNMSPALVSERVEPFVKTLRGPARTRPSCWPKIAASGASARRRKGPSCAIHQKLTAQGMKNLHFLSNQGMLGDDTEGTVDGCHPNDLGMMRQAGVFAKALAPLLP